MASLSLIMSSLSSQSLRHRQSPCLPPNFPFVAWEAPKVVRIVRPLISLSVHAKQEEQGEVEYINYNQNISVFPAEACEEVGGESCEVEGVGPEVKPNPSSSKKEATSYIEEKDREYVEYSGDKTVFPGEACDDLGGEFCAPEYQNGVFPEKAAKAN